MSLSLFVGSYDGILLGFKGTHQSLENVYSFQASTGSIKSLLVYRKFLFLGGYDEIIKIYDLKTQKEVGQLEGHEGSIVALKSFKNYFFSAGEDGNICVWKMKEWVLMHKFQAHKRPIIDFALHSSGKMLISISKDRKMHIWNLLNFTKSFSRKFSYGNLKINLSFITHHKDLFKILFNHNEDSLILQSEKAIHILSFSTNKMLAVLEHPSKLQDFVLYKENFLISGDDQGYIFFWDLTTNHHIKFKAHQNRIKSIKLVLSSSDLADSMDFLVTCSSDGKICFWDTLYLLGELKIIEEDKDLGTDIRNVICIESRQRINCLEIVQKVEENQEEKAEIKKDIEVVKKKIKKLKKKGKKINNKNKKLEI